MTKLEMEGIWESSEKNRAGEGKDREGEREKTQKNWENEELWRIKEGKKDEIWTEKSREKRN